MHQEIFHELVEQLTSRLGLWLIVLAGVVGVALLVLRKLREETGGDSRTDGNAYRDIQEIHERGEFTEAEYRKIKAVLAAKLQRDVKDGKDKG